MTLQPTMTDDGTAPPDNTAPPIAALMVEPGPFYDESTEPGIPRTRRTGPFIATKEYRRFTEFADAVRRETFIGLCYGPAGVGKTLSARRYARWDKVEELLLGWGRRQESDAAVYATLARSRTAFYTPTTTCTPKQLEQDLDQLLRRINICVAQHRRAQTTLPVPSTVHHQGTPQVVDLLIVDEAERLTQQSLEHLRDRFDRRATGLILIGMPGIDRSLSRHPPALQPHRLRPPVPDPGRRRARVRPDPALGQARPHPGPVRLHRRPGRRRRRTRHPRELPARPPPLRPGRPRHEDQQPHRHHQRRHRDRPRHPRHRRGRHIAPTERCHLPLPVTRQCGVSPRAVSLPRKWNELARPASAGDRPGGGHRPSDCGMAKSVTSP